MVSIREAQTDDIPRMQQILEDALRQRGTDAYTTDEIDILCQPYNEVFRDSISDEHSVYLLAVDDDSTVGFGGIQYKHGRITGLYVHPDAADSGIGTRLLRQLEEYAEQPNYRGLGVLASLNAVEFYEQLGYQKQFKRDIEMPDGRLAPAMFMIHYL